jgi:hypothetical protein
MIFGGPSWRTSTVRPDPCFEAISPWGVDQDASRVFVTAFGDGALTAARSARVLRGDEPKSKT